MSQPRSLSIVHWLSIAASLLLLAVVVGIVFEQQVFGWYFTRIVCPALEKPLGFRLGHRAVTSAAYEVPIIAAITPGGPMAAAGVNVGDVPIGYVHGSEAGFCSDLSRAERTGSAELTLIPFDHLGSMTRVRRVLLRVPATSEPQRP